MTDWGKDKRPFFGGPYPYEVTTVVYLPSGVSAESVDGGALESRGLALLGQIEGNRRLAGLPSMATHYTDADGTYFEYGFIMGKPFVRVWPVVSQPQGAGKYQPAIAYVPASTSFGDTFKFVVDATLVAHADNRARSLVTQYYRFGKGAADVVLAPGSSLAQYKGNGFVLQGAATLFLAAVLDDPTNGKTLSSSTAGTIYTISVESPSGDVKIRKARLPAINAWKRMGSSGLPDVDMGVATGTIAESIPKFLCSGAPWFGASPFGDFNTLNIYRYKTEGENEPGSLVSSYSKSTQPSVELTPYTTSTISGSSITATTTFSDSVDIQNWPSSQQLKLVSVLSTNPVPLVGTATRSVSAETTINFTTPPTPAVANGAAGVAAYDFTEDTHGTQRFIGHFCGAAIDVTETIDYSRASDARMDYSFTYVTDHQYGHNSHLTGSDEVSLTYVKKSLSFVFGDATFGVAVVLEKTLTLTYSHSFTTDIATSLSPTSVGFSESDAPNISPPASYTIAYFDGFRPTRPDSGAPSYPFPNDSPPLDGTTTDGSTASSAWGRHDVREVVMYKDGIEIGRHEYYNHTDSAWNTLQGDKAPTVWPLYIVAHPSTPEIAEIFGQRTAQNMVLSMVGSIPADDASVTCDEHGVYVEVVWVPPGGSAQRMFIDSTGDDWAAQSGITTGGASTLSKLFRV